MDAMKPGPDAKPEPYFAIMELEDDEEATTGNVWALGERIMLFESEDEASAVLGSVNANGAPPHGIRGVTSDHLAAMKELAAQQNIEIFVVESIEGGQVEAVPLAAHQA